MIVTEQFYVGDKLFNRAYSDRGVMIHGGVPEGDYSEACDPADAERTYIETEILIDNDSMEINKAEEILDIVLGGSR